MESADNIAGRVHQRQILLAAQVTEIATDKQSGIAARQREHAVGGWELTAGVVGGVQNAGVCRLGKAIYVIRVGIGDLSKRTAEKDVRLNNLDGFHRTVG